MTTARTIIESALRKINSLGSGESLAAEDAADGLQALNAMLGSWSVTGDLVYTMTWETFAVTGGTYSYNIGPGQTFDTDRPLEIFAMNLTAPGGVTYPIAELDERQYSAISIKTISGIPYGAYYDANSPIANFKFYYVPSTAYAFNIYSRKVLTEFTTLNTDLDFPPGYEKALIYNLSIELAPEYQKEPSPTVVRMANESRSAISVQNTRNQNNAVALDAALTRMGQYYSGFNIYAGS